jgi:predicted transcriptional regulator
MGVQEFEIIKKFKGNYGLVKMWLSFLLHNHYMAKEFHPDVGFIYSVTDKGKEFLDRYRHGQQNSSSDV